MTIRVRDSDDQNPGEWAVSSCFVASVSAKVDQMARIKIVEVNWISPVLHSPSSCQLPTSKSSSQHWLTLNNFFLHSVHQRSVQSERLRERQINGKLSRLVVHTSCRNCPECQGGYLRVWQIALSCFTVSSMFCIVWGLWLACSWSPFLSSDDHLIACRCLEVAKIGQIHNSTKSAAARHSTMCCSWGGIWCGFS